MRIPASAASLAILATAASAAPSYVQSHQPLGQLAFTAVASPAASLSSWISASVGSIWQPLIDHFGGGLDTASSLEVKLARATEEGKSIYDVITEYEEFSQLAKAVSHASESTKDLLKGKTGAKLTLFAPVNWHKHDDRDDDDDALVSEYPAEQSASKASLSQGKASWALVEEGIRALEENHGNDDDDDERKRRHLAHLVDAVLAYHLVGAEEPLLAADIIQNSTIATKFSVPAEAAKIIGPLNDGLPLRIRITKLLLPKPGVYLNFYSPVVYKDVKLSNGILHAVKYPLFQFPSILAGLYSAQPEFSTLTTAFLKTDAAGYLALPVPKHRKGTEQDDQHASHHDDHRASFSDPKGTPASTLFAPSNLAWDALPWAFRAYLFSPWGRDLLGKILMLHSIPRDIIYADSVHHVKHHNKPSEFVTATISSNDQSWTGLAGLFEGSARPYGDVNVTKYTFDSVLPKLKEGEPLPPPDRATEFEQVDVEVFRCHVLPGGKGPLLTKLRVQNEVPVIVSDIVNLNGASHLINHFIKPKGHPHKGIWADLASEVKARGFGEVDLAAEFRANKW
ncbi:unnamed protein product [Parajaminaea phylloscopi]